MKLGIVIVHYNSSADLERCLESLAAYAPRAPHRVVIIDNASSDPGLAAVQRRYPDCDWVFNPENVGYARGCNQGMARVEAEYHLILNPDIVLQPGAVDRLLAFADRHPRAGLVGPQLLNEDGSIQDSCRRFYTFKTLLLRRTILGRIFPDSETVRRHLMHDFDHCSDRPVDWVLGGCLLVRRSAVERTGPMDERFFLYFEDVDWCYRMWQAGCEVLYTPEARFLHRHRRDSARGALHRGFWLHLGSLISFYEKWGMLVWLLKKWRDPLLVLLMWLLDVAGLTLAFAAAYGLRHLLGPLFAEPLYPFGEYRPLLIYSWLLASLTFLLTGRYRPERLRRRAAPGEHFQQVGVVSLLLLASTYLGHLDVISRAVLLMYLPLLGVATAAGETLLRRVMRRLQRGNLSLERTLLVGPPAALPDWLGRGRDLSGQGVDVAGYVADPRSPDEGLPPLAHGAVPWLGGTADLLEVVRRYRISQVVFWQRPTTDDSWRLLAGLRRLRVRLRWAGDDVWLVAAGARPELFGGQLSAVQGGGGGWAAQLLGWRLLSATVGGVLLLTGWLPWLWLRLVRLPRGGAQRAVLPVGDLWGHQARLDLMADGGGRVLPLPWQWRLAGPLLAGRLGVIGSRPQLGEVSALPNGPLAVLDFWQRAPRVPGLSGPWAVPAATRNPGAGAEARSTWAGLVIILKRMWHDPGGCGVLPRSASAVGPDASPPPSANEVSRS